MNFLKVAISMDRYLAIRFKNWSNQLFNNKRAAIVSIGIILFFFLANINMFFTFGVISKLNGTERFTCYTVNEESYWMDVWRTVNYFDFFLLKKNFLF